MLYCFNKKYMNKEKKLVGLLILVFLILPMAGAFFRIVYGNNMYTNMGLFLVLVTEGIVIGKIVYDSYKRKRQIIKT